MQLFKLSLKAALLAGLLTLTFGCQPRQTESTSTGAEAPFLAGSTTLFIHDNSRPFDAVAGVDSGVRERGSFTDAPLAPSETPWPVIVMSHGDAGSRYNMETVCEHLARHGYIVIAPEHTGNSPFSMIGRDPALADDVEFRQRMAPGNA